MIPTAKPTVLFAPGAWHGPEGFDMVRKQLEVLSYPTVAVAHPSIGAEPPTKHLSDDAAHLRAAIEELVNADKEVILVVHSYGGAVGACASEGLSQARRAAEGKAGGIIMLVYMSAFVVPLGKSLKDMLGGQWLPWMKFDGDYSNPSDSANIFYNDMSEDDQKLWISRLKHNSASVFSDPITYEPWKEMSCLYFFCERDNAIPLPIQEMLAQTLGDGRTEFRCSASHSPFLSMPGKVVECVELAAKVGVEKKVKA